MPHQPGKDHSTPPWLVRPYQEGDEVQGAALFREVFGKPMTPAHYRWKVGTSPLWAAAATVWYADLNGELIGQYAGTPMRFKLGEATYPILHACDVMTAAAYRGQGVLTAVGTAAHQAWSQAGLPFLTALHYGGWGSRRAYLGWKEHFNAVWLWRPLRLGTLLSTRRRLPSVVASSLDGLGLLWNRAWGRRLRTQGQRIQVDPVDETGSVFDRLWEHLHGYYEALVVRDSAWIAYRYLQASDYTYRVLLAHREGHPSGYLVYRLVTTPERSFGMIADLFTDPEDRPTQSALLHTALDALSAEGATDVRVLVPTGTRLFKTFKRAGFVRGKGSYDISIVPLADAFPYDVLQDPTRWFTLGGDFDVV